MTLVVVDCQTESAHCLHRVGQGFLLELLDRFQHRNSLKRLLVVKGSMDPTAEFGASICVCYLTSILKAWRPVHKGTIFNADVSVINQLLE
jgi:hypothetical protein